jgi:hypothetical protein
MRACGFSPAGVELEGTIAEAKTMVYQGTVQNGLIVLENGVHLPEGAPVRVELVNAESPQQSLAAEDDALLRMSELAVDTGIPDLAVNIDHYLYGHPKVTDGQ